MRLFLLWLLVRAFEALPGSRDLPKPKTGILSFDGGRTPAVQRYPSNASGESEQSCASSSHQGVEFILLHKIPGPNFPGYVLVSSEQVHHAVAAYTLARPKAFESAAENLEPILIEYRGLLMQLGAAKPNLVF